MISLSGLEPLNVPVHPISPTHVVSNARTIISRGHSLQFLPPNVAYTHLSFTRCIATNTNTSVT